jgi:polar amino acid transport system permease protein/polar amino acid transport system substrate-binding protein
MNLSFLLDSYYLILLLKGLGMTLLLSLLAVVSGSVLGFLLTLVRLSKIKIFSQIALLYVEIFRGTPLLVQVLLLYAFINIPVTIFLGIDLSSFIPGMLALTLNSTAYVSELIRGGIHSIDSGQSEASLSLGLSESQTMRHVIMPQAFKVMIPSLGNEFVTIIKETSIFMYLGISELMYSAMMIKVQSYRIKEVYLVVAILYFVLTYPTSKLMLYIESRLKVSQ